MPKYKLAGAEWIASFPGKTNFLTWYAVSANRLHLNPAAQMGSVLIPPVGFQFLLLLLLLVQLFYSNI